MLETGVIEKFSPVAKRIGMDRLPLQTAGAFDR
jgi:hypothetical protein